MKKPLVCIIIINWNGGKTTLDCLDSLQKTTYPNYKVIILDNGSKDGSDKIIEKNFKKFELLRSDKNLGYTAGINYAWSHCIKKYPVKYFCNMNNDIVTVQPEWLDLMVNQLEKSKENGICGNKLVFPDNRVQLLYLERPHTEYEEKDNGQYDYVKEVSAVGGANMLVKRNVVDAIGGSDENYFYGPDDIDYCFRARQRGFKVFYNGLSKSIHLGSFSYLSSSKDFIYGHQSYGQMIFSFRWGSWSQRLVMPLQQLLRAFITRKDPFRRRKAGNFYFHKSCLSRVYKWSKSFYNALRNYKYVNLEHYGRI